MGISLLLRSLAVGLCASCATEAPSTPSHDRIEKAEAASTTTTVCDPADGIPLVTLRANRTYQPPPPRSSNAALLFYEPHWLFVPDAALVAAGQSGNHLATFRWQDDRRFQGLCVFHGSGTQSSTTTCTNNGDSYLLDTCTFFGPQGPVVIPRGGVIELSGSDFQPSSVSLTVVDGDPCATTRIEMLLRSPPDRDANGTPDCLEVPSDTEVPTWPPGSALSATPTGTSAVLGWSAAVDNVAVTGYRIFQDSQLIREVDGSTLSVEVSGLSPNVIHVFQVQAVDAAGNVSQDGPSAAVRIDTTPPIWPPGSALGATGSGTYIRPGRAPLSVRLRAPTKRQPRAIVGQSE